MTNSDNPPRESVFAFSYNCDRCGKEIPAETLCVLFWEGKNLQRYHVRCATKQRISWGELPQLTFTQSQMVTGKKYNHWYAEYKGAYFEIKREKGEYAVIRDHVCWFATTSSLEGAVLFARHEAHLVRNQIRGNVVPNSKQKKSENNEKGFAFSPRVGENAFNNSSGDVPGQLPLFSAKEPQMPRITKSSTAAPATPVAATLAPKKGKKVADPNLVPIVPPKPRVALTADEVEALVTGNLQPRDEAGDPNQEALTLTTESGKNAGRPIGVTTGLPIQGAWGLAFQENEKPSSKVIRSLGRAPDEEITKFMKTEFPGRQSPIFDHPQGARNYFNKGFMTKNVKPKWQSSQYDVKGKVVTEDESTSSPKKAATAPAAPAPAPAPVKKVKKVAVPA